MRNWSRLKLCHAVSLRLGLKGVKIAQNVVKVGVHSYLSKGHPNLWSNFNYEKLVKSETSSFIFGRVGLSCARFYVCLLNGYLNLLLNLISKKLEKSATFSKIARNPLKVCMHGYLSNGYLNSLSNFTYKKFEK